MQYCDKGEQKKSRSHFFTKLIDSPYCQKYYSWHISRKVIKTSLTKKKIEEQTAKKYQFSHPTHKKLMLTQTLNQHLYFGTLQDLPKMN